MVALIVLFSCSWTITSMGKYGVSLPFAFKIILYYNMFTADICKKYQHTPIKKEKSKHVLLLYANIGSRTTLYHVIWFTKRSGVQHPIILMLFIP